MVASSVIGCVVEHVRQFRKGLGAIALLTLVVAACGADNTDGIVVAVQGVPALFDAKLDNGAWKTYTPEHVVDGNAVYNVPTFLSTIDAVFVCENADGTLGADETRTTDPKDLGTYCERTVEREQLVVTIHGAAAQTKVVVYDVEEQSDQQTDIQYTITAPKRNADVIVYDATRFTLQRDIDLVHGPTEVVFDMVTAPKLRTGYYTYDPPDSDETLADTSGFSTANASIATFFVGAGTYQAPDGSLLEPTDFGFAELDAVSSTSERAIRMANPDPATPITTHWPSRITGTIDDNRTAATFNAPYPDFDIMSVRCDTSSGHEALSITRGYHDLHADEVAFNESIPGWNWTLGMESRRCAASIRQPVDAVTTVYTTFY